MSSEPLAAEALPARTGALARAWAWLDDRLNPILVKEVRQALRGRYFRNLFWLTVVAATGISVLNILTYDPSSAYAASRLGTGFFTVNFWVMTFAIDVFVPFWAFQSMGGEWEENTYDLLVISDLRPRHLILGKALGAAVQTLLFFSAFAPFLVSTFLMGGVDFLSIVAVLTGSLMLSVALSLLAIAVACFGRSRLARAGSAVTLIASLIWFAGMTSFAGSMLIQEPEVFSQPGFEVAIWLFVVIVVVTGTLALAVGCARLAHEHENRSTLLRAIVAFGMLLLTGWGVSSSSWAGRSADLVFVWVAVSISVAMAIVPFLFFVTEAEPLGRRVTTQVPRSRWLALLAHPFLPGGGRGLCLYALLSFATVAMVGIAVATRPGTSLLSGGVFRLSGNDPLQTLAFAIALLAYGFVVLGFLSGVASFHIKSLKGRTGVRVAIPLLLIAAVVGPALLGFLLDERAWADFNHPFNPIWVLSTIDNPTGPDVFGISALVIGVLLTCLVNAPRGFRSLAETLRASAARRGPDPAEPR